MTRNETIQNLESKLIERRKQLLGLLFGKLSNLHNSDDAIGADIVDLAVEVDYATVKSARAEIECRELELIEDGLSKEFGAWLTCN